MSIRDRAERNEEGELVINEGHKKNVNVTKLLNPGRRKTSNVMILLAEARLINEEPDRDMNPAFPTNSDIADEAISRIEAEDLRPAWQVVYDN